jgi:membrane protein YqaA with SNARE-associated domain
LYKRCIVMVADGGRADLMKQLLDEGRLPNIKQHIVDRGCFKKALSVFPSTTGPAHIPFVSGLHPGTANIPGYRWLCRETHDTRRRDIYRHRSLNSPRGLLLGRDMDPRRGISLYQFFEKPSSVLELVDYCPNKPLYKLIARRLYRIVRAHHTDDWSPVDRMVERHIIKRIKAGSECIVASFFGIDEYSHLYSPFDSRTVGAYLNIDRAIGSVVEALQDNGVYGETILAVVSDHGLTATTVHIPLVDIVKEHGFTPHYYPKVYRRSCDSAVMESGNAMAMLYFKRGEKWGEHWRWEEMVENDRVYDLIETLRATDGLSFLAARTGDSGVLFAGPDGFLQATRLDGHYHVTIEGENPLPDHPAGVFLPEELFERTYDHVYPDAVNQLFLLFSSARSGDIALSSDPSYDLRLQHEDPEHHSSHGSLHREHMQVPLAFSVPLRGDRIYNYDLVPTILALTGKQPTRPFDGRILESENGHYPEEVLEAAPVLEPELDTTPQDKRNGLASFLITAGIILTGLIIVGMFKKQINELGHDLLVTFGQGWVDAILFGLTAVSSTPLMLPIWGYVIAGVQLGYNVYRLATVMAAGSALGSFVTYLLGRYFAENSWVKKRFNNMLKHPWSKGRSRKFVTMMLFIGTASPLPCDVFYVACGAKRYPRLLFLGTTAVARFVRYLYLGFGFKFFMSWM